MNLISYIICLTNLLCLNISLVDIVRKRKLDKTKIEMNNKHIWDTINKIKDENKELKEEIERLKQNKNTPE